MKVAIDRINTYEINALKEKLYTLVSSTNFPSVKDKTVLIKPNILSDAPEHKAITTNANLVEAVALILKELGAKSIYIGDSPGLQKPGFDAHASGIKKAVENTGSIFVDFSKSTRDHKVYKNINVPMTTIIDEVDVVISVAKFKTHQLMMYTGCVKNMFGLIPGLNKSPLHLKCPSPEEFAKLLISIFKESHTDYAIMDAIIAMEGPGPANGNARNVGLLMASEDAYAIDYAEAVIMGYKRKDMILTNEAIREGLLDVNDIEYPILDAMDLVISDYKRIESKRRSLFSALIMPYFTKFFSNRKDRKKPVPNFQDNCIKCKRCIEICPAKALTLGTNKPMLDKNKCIRCYCCHEMCPADAIKI